MNIIEQFGRYGCFILMWLPLFVWKFGFGSVAEMFIYMIGNLALLLAYLIIWIFYFRRQSVGKALALAILPTLIFFLSGLTLRHWVLVILSVMFGIGHIYVTWQNNR